MTDKPKNIPYALTPFTSLFFQTKRLRTEDSWQKIWIWNTAVFSNFWKIRSVI